MRTTPGSAASSRICAAVSLAEKPSTIPSLRLTVNEPATRCAPAMLNEPSVATTTACRLPRSALPRRRSSTSSTWSPSASERRGELEGRSREDAAPAGAAGTATARIASRVKPIRVRRAFREPSFPTNLAQRTWPGNMASVHRRERPVNQSKGLPSLRARPSPERPSPRSYEGTVSGARRGASAPRAR